MRIPRSIFCLLVLATAALFAAALPAAQAADADAELWPQAADRFLGPYVMLVPTGELGKLTLIVAPNDDVFPVELPAEANAETVTFHVSVTPTGSVARAIPAAEPNRGRTETRRLSEIASTLMAWRFKPLHNDNRGAATIVQDVPILIVKDPHLVGRTIRYPDVAEAASFRLHLSHQQSSRSNPLGNASYVLEIGGDGDVVYNGKGRLVATGERRSKIGTKEARDLVAKLTAINPLKAAERAVGHSRGDGSGSAITLSFGDKALAYFKQPYDETRPPNALDEMALATHRTAGAERWTATPSLANKGDDLKAAGHALAEFAADNGDIALVRDLISRSAPLSPKALAAGANRSDGADFARMMIAHGASASDALEFAAEARQVKAVEVLLAVDKNMRRTSLTQSMLSLARHGEPGIVRALIGAGADAHGRGKGGETLLTQACVAGDVRTVSIALARGVAADAKTDEGKAALHEAVGRDRIADRIEIIRALSKAGADINVRDRRQATPLMYAVHDDRLTNALIKARADLNALNDKNQDALGYKCPTPRSVRALFAAGMEQRLTHIFDLRHRCWSEEEQAEGRDILDQLDALLESLPSTPITRYAPGNRPQ